MKETYKTFIQSHRNWKEFAKARKITQQTGLTYDRALKICENYNNHRTARQIKRGTMMEFEQE